MRELTGLLSVACEGVGRTAVLCRPGNGETLTLADTLGSVVGVGAPLLRDELRDAEDDVGVRLADVPAVDRLELGWALPGRVVALVGA